jgi:hypothetical protein
MLKNSPERDVTPSHSASTESQVWLEKIRATGADDAALLRLAHQAPGVDLKLAAIEALTHEDSFRRAMREFGAQDKRLYRAARSRWEAASGRRKTAVKANALIANARALLEQESIPVNRAVELDQAWNALDAALLDPALQSEFSALSAQLGAKARALGEGEREIVRWLAEVDQAMGKVRASLADVAQGDVPPAATEALAADLLEWLGRVHDASDARCIEKIDAANRVLALASSVTQRAQFLYSLPALGMIDEALEKDKIEQWRAIPEVYEPQLQSVLAHRFADWRNACQDARQREQDAHRAREQEEKAEQKKQRLSAIERDVEAAEAAHAAGHVAELTRCMNAIERALKSGPVNAALNRRIDALHREQLRLRDWQRWSGRQGREQLVAEAQALASAAAGKVAIKAHAEAIDKLRERWKELDKLGGATNQTLWLAFDGALKTAHAPVAAHLEKLKLAREENLAARNRIIADLVQAAAQYFPVTPNGAAPAPAAEPDWRAVARAIEEAQVAWRKLGPVEHTVPRKALTGEHAVTARFAAAQQALQGPLEATYQVATRHREELVAAAKGLVGPEGVVREAVDKVRKLQAQWQAQAKALPLPRREENALWTAFKSATDAVFTALDASRAAKEAEFGARIKAREDIIERLVALSCSSTAAEIKRGMTDADAAWRAAAEVPKPQGVRLEARYRSARDAAVRRLGELATHASQARFDALLAALALCDERERSPEPAADLDARWDAIENLPDPWRARLQARLRGAGTQSGPPSSSAAASKSGGKAGASLPELLLKLEGACGIDSPPEFLADRQQLKLRALKEAMEARRPIVTTAEDIERWLLDAAASPRPDESSRERLAKIVAAVRLRRSR